MIALKKSGISRAALTFASRLTSAARTSASFEIPDRKSTRLNSSHSPMRYPVFLFTRLSPPLLSTLYPYTTLFRSPVTMDSGLAASRQSGMTEALHFIDPAGIDDRAEKIRNFETGFDLRFKAHLGRAHLGEFRNSRSEEHTS